MDMLRTIPCHFCVNTNPRSSNVVPCVYVQPNTVRMEPIFEIGRMEQQVFQGQAIIFFECIVFILLNSEVGSRKKMGAIGMVWARVGICANVATGFVFQLLPC
jgi:hypothetical protein